MKNENKNKMENQNKIKMENENKDINEVDENIDENIDEDIDDTLNFIPLADTIVTDKTVIVHFIRHAQAYHNIHPEFITEEEKLAHYMRSEFFDSSLTPMGLNQSLALLKENLEIDVFLISPMVRTIETALPLIIDNPRPIFISENAREAIVRHNFPCNRRNSRTYISKILNPLKVLTIGHIKNNDPFMDPNKIQSSEEFDKIIDNLLEDIYKLAYKFKRIVVVSHSMTISTILNKFSYIHRDYIKNAEVVSMVLVHGPRTKKNDKWLDKNFEQLNRSFGIFEQINK